MRPAGGLATDLGLVTDLGRTIGLDPGRGLVEWYFAGH
jgi:hypothetical protein